MMDVTRPSAILIAVWSGQLTSGRVPDGPLGFRYFPGAVNFVFAAAMIVTRTSLS